MSDDKKYIQMSFRITPELHKKARIKAFQEGISMTKLISDFLEHWVSEDDEPQKENPDQ